MWNVTMQKPTCYSLNLLLELDFPTQIQPANTNNWEMITQVFDAYKNVTFSLKYMLHFLFFLADTKYSHKFMKQLMILTLSYINGSSSFLHIEQGHCT